MEKLRSAGVSLLKALSSQVAVIACSLILARVAPSVLFEITNCGTINHCMKIFSKIISEKGMKPLLFKKGKRVVENNNQPVQTTLKFKELTNNILYNFISQQLVHCSPVESLPVIRHHISAIGELTGISRALLSTFKKKKTKNRH